MILLLAGHPRVVEKQRDAQTTLTATRDAFLSRKKNERRRTAHGPRLDIRPFIDNALGSAKKDCLVLRLRSRLRVEGLNSLERARESGSEERETEQFQG